MAFSPCSDLYFVQPVLSGHLAIPRGWPLNTGSTVQLNGKLRGQALFYVLVTKIKEKLFKSI